MSALRVAVSACLIVALAALLYAAARAGLADVRSKSPRAEIARWTKAQKAPQLPHWRAALEAMRTARELEPANASLTETSGRIYDWAAFGQSDRNPAAMAFRRQALAHFRTTARQRPTSPYTWANVALMKSRVGELDAEYFGALRNAAFLGPWEDEVQLILAEATLQNWRALPEDIRTLAAQNVERASLRQAKDLVQIARTHKQLALVCGAGRRIDPALCQAPKSR